MRHLALAVMGALALGFSAPACAEDLTKEAYAVSVQTDMVYGQGVVGATSASPHSRDLKMDVYRPLANGKLLTGRPWVVLAFGGAYHRGSKGMDRFEEDGASDSAMGDYCRYICGGGLCLPLDRISACARRSGAAKRS